MKEQWHAVCLAADIKDYMGVCALIGGLQIALFRVKDQFFAIDNFDPFSKASVISRGIVGDLKGRLVVASPVFKQHFDLETGLCMEDPSVRVNSYPVRFLYGLIEVATVPLVPNKVS